MSRGVNKVILVGNLGQKPEMRYTATQTAVANLSIATTESWKDKESGENRDKTEWHKVVFFGNLAEIAEKYLEKVDMLNRVMHYPQQLSGGEQQRVAIARAFACEAKVLFCDEPTGNLDSTNSKMISDLLFDVFNESSTALIIVTHDEDLADRCDQKIRLIDGKIQ